MFRHKSVLLNEYPKPLGKFYKTFRKLLMFGKHGTGASLEFAKIND